MSAFQFNPTVKPFTRDETDAEPDQQREAARGRPLVRLQNNENPLGPSPLVLEAINAVAPSLSYYPSFSDLALRRAIVDLLGRDLTPQHIFTGCSGFEALELIMRAALLPGDELILSSPTFAGAYKKVALPLGASVIDVPLEAETFRYRPDAVLDAITERSKIVMVCNPNNPTGSLVSAAAMDRLMRGLPDHVLVVADEVYHHFVDDSDFPVSLDYVLQGRNIVIVHSFSKAYGMAGMRLGYGIAKSEIANTIAGLQRGFHQNKLALAAGIAACRDQGHVRRVVAYLREETRWVCAQFDRLDIRYWPPAANFILFETRLPAEALQGALRARGFLLRGQSRNGLPYGMRLSLGTRESNSAFVDALEGILDTGRV